MSNNQIHHNLFKLRVMVILAGVSLMIGGMVMIFMDLKSDGSISIKTPFLAGSINATYIGLLVIFMGVVLNAIAIMRTFTQKDNFEISRVLEGSKKPKFKAIDNPTDKELRKQFEQKFGFQIPESWNLSDPLLKRSLQDLTTTPANSQRVNRETFKVKSETSGARLATRR